MKSDQSSSAAITLTVLAIRERVREREGGGGGQRKRHRLKAVSQWLTGRTYQRIKKCIDEKMFQNVSDSLIVLHKPSGKCTDYMTHLTGLISCISTLEAALITKHV